MRLVLLAFLIALIVMPSVMAFGVTPGRQTYDYRPEISGSFTIVNNDAKNHDLTIVARGDLAEHVRFSETSVRMGPGDAERTISYTVELPRNLEPGEHTIEAYILSLASNSAGGSIVGAATGVVSQIKIKVPYPGKYVRSRLDYDATTNTVIVPVFGLGSDRIDDLSADVVVYGPTNEVVASQRSDTRTLFVGGNEEFSFPLDVQSGNYLARATVSFGDRTQVVERTINVGRAQVVVQDVSVPEYQFGAISKLVLHAKSEWNEPIDTSATVEFYDEGSLIERVRSAQVRIEPFARADIDIYWDSAGYDPGEYRIVAKVTAGNETAERSFPVTLTPSEISIGASGNVTAGGGGISLILVAVLVLVVLNIGLLYVLFRRKK